ncbi:DUF3185 domain-containing protein [Granulicella cerasi]|uniref:DUF3185 domain-containing protein n=1 Tax=Granulicella cerasi TaxID=741063 RepID=A0ABW1Z7A3_9BACT|nr:DUF3185 domain-containing protein [Granulicella cerasi]
MKAATVIGIVLVLLGIVGFAMGGFSFSHEKKDVDMGPLQISHQKKETVPIPPILSGIALLGGIGLIVVGAKSK